jgi:hypothetical protein
VRTTILCAALATPLFVFAFAPEAHAQYRPPVYYPGSRYVTAESDLKIRVKPKQASVYVDGYFAGKVDEFDGALQRLHVEPGQHEIVVYMPGHRSLRQRLYLSAGATRTIEGELEPLEPGAPDEPEPLPAEPAVERERADRDADRPPVQSRRPPRPMPPAAAPEPPRAETPSASRFGTVAIQVDPEGATILIDGERWTAPSGDERLIVQVEPGHHRLEVRKDGYNPYVTEIDVPADRTLPVNVSLSRPK